MRVQIETRLPTSAVSGLLLETAQASVGSLLSNTLRELFVTLTQAWTSIDRHGPAQITSLSRGGRKRSAADIAARVAVDQVTSHREDHGGSRVEDPAPAIVVDG